MTKEAAPAAPLDPPKSERKPYERMDGESARAFGWFEKYRSLPPTERGLRRIPGYKASVRRQIERYSSKYEWVRRVDAWDDDVAERSRQATIDAVTQMNERQAMTGMVIVSKVLEKMAEIPADQIQIKDVAALLTAAVKTEREARGVAGATSKVELETKDAKGRVVPIMAWLAGKGGDDDEDDQGH